MRHRCHITHAILQQTNAQVTLDRIHKLLAIPKRITAVFEHCQYQFQTEYLGIQSEGIDGGCTGKEDPAHRRGDSSSSGPSPESTHGICWDGNILIAGQCLRGEFA